MNYDCISYLLLKNVSRHKYTNLYKLLKYLQVLTVVREIEVSNVVIYILTVQNIEYWKQILIV